MLRHQVRGKGWALLVSAVIIGTACGLIAPLLSRQRLLNWYLREVRRVPLPEAPGERIVTYPLA